MTTLIQYVVDAAALAGLYALIALGVALIFGVLNFINFAHGELVMVGGYVLVVMATQPTLVAIAVSLVVVVVVALGMERVAFRPLRGANPTTLLITSFALSFLLQNVARLTVGSLPRSVGLPEWLSESVVVGGVVVSNVALVQAVSAAVLLVGLWLFLTRTNIGIEMRAAAEDFSMSQLLGVRANRVVAVAFAISGFLAGVVAVLVVAQLGVVTPTIGLAPVLVGFVATVLGGLRSLVGAVLGAAVLGVLTVAMQAALPGDVRAFRDAFVFAGVILLLLVRPEGLLGARTAVERV